MYVVGSVSDSSVEHSIKLFCGNILLGILTLPNSIEGRLFRSILDRIGERNEAPSFILACRKILLLGPLLTQCRIQASDVRLTQSFTFKLGNDIIPLHAEPFLLPLRAHTSLGGSFGLPRVIVGMRVASSCASLPYSSVTYLLKAALCHLFLT